MEWKKLSHKLWLLVAGVPILFLLVIILVFWVLYPTTSPFTAISFYLDSLKHPHAKIQKNVIGFLPYWRLADSQYIHFPLISEIDYFSLTVDGKGNIVKTVGNETEPGWFDWNSTKVKDLIAQTQITGNKFVLTFAIQKNKDIESLLNNKNSQTNFIQQTVQQMSSRHLNGINLDVEYVGEPNDSLKNNFTTFAKDFTSAIRKTNAKASTSIDFLPTGGRDKGLFDFSKLAPLFDRFIIMSYDYYSASSDIAGPIAPMRGFKEGNYFFDVTTTYSDYEKVLPKEKLVMGVPYYGWDWPVANGQKVPTQVLDQTDANGYPAVLSYGRMKQDADLKPNQCFWDTIAASPWCWYVDNTTGKQHQVWFENERSIRTKFAYATSENFAGIALWTLGFDKQYEDLWGQIKTSFTTN